MSYSNSTTHYGLPLPTGSDKSLFTDTNQAFQDIDAAIYTAETVSSSAATDITAIKATMVNLQNADITFQSDITNLKGRMTAVEGVASQNTTDIADVRSDAEDMITAHNEPTATSAHAYSIGDEFIYNDVLYRATAAIAIGDTIVPNTNCAATNVMTEVNAIQADLSGFTQVTLFSGQITAGDDITLSEHINNSRFIVVVDDNLQSESATMINSFYNQAGRGLTINCGITDVNSTLTPPVLCISDLALTNTDGEHYHVERSGQINLSATGVEYFTDARTSTISIYGYK